MEHYDSRLYQAREKEPRYREIRLKLLITRKLCEMSQKSSYTMYDKGYWQISNDLATVNINKGSSRITAKIARGSPNSDLEFAVVSRIGLYSPALVSLGRKTRSWDELCTREVREIYSVIQNYTFDDKMCLEYIQTNLHTHFFSERKRILGK